MSQDIYELIAMVFRYIFVALLASIIFFGVKSILRERDRYRRIMAELPYSGLIGEVVVVGGEASLPLPREGLIGSGRLCDIRIRHLPRRAMAFEYEAGHGLRLHPIHKRSRFALEGSPIRGLVYAGHGSRITLANTVLRVRLFEGLDDGLLSAASSRAVSGETHLPEEGVHAPQTIGQDTDINDMPETSGVAEEKAALDKQITWPYALPSQRLINDDCQESHDA